MSSTKKHALTHEPVTVIVPLFVNGPLKNAGDDVNDTANVPVEVTTSFPAPDGATVPADHVDEPVILRSLFGLMVPPLIWGTALTIWSHM